MITHNIAENISMKEIINQIEMDANATNREKFLVEKILSAIEGDTGLDDAAYRIIIHKLEYKIRELKIDIEDLKDNARSAA